MKFEQLGGEKLKFLTISTLKFSDLQSDEDLDGTLVNGQKSALSTPRVESGDRCPKSLSLRL